MNDTISRSWLLETIAKYKQENERAIKANRGYHSGILFSEHLIENAPDFDGIPDAVRVIRCKDCGHCFELAATDPLTPYHGGEEGFYCQDHDTDYYMPHYNPETYYCADAKPRVAEQPAGLYALRTDVRPSARSAQMAWNARPASAARVLTLDELIEAEAGRMDDEDVQAAWIETRADGAVLAGLISTGFDRDLCAAVDIMDTGGIWHAVPRRIMREYGHTWRVWSDCPTPAQRAQEPWDRELYSKYQFLEDGPG